MGRKSVHYPFQIHFRDTLSILHYTKFLTVPENLNDFGKRIIKKWWVIGSLMHLQTKERRSYLIYVNKWVNHMTGAVLKQIMMSGIVRNFLMLVIK
ncbi:hypothetical protein VC88_02430 [Geobacillus sp. A8]|nr:hypothetical protein GT3921_17520 [Geobacillus thermocatenulatus]KLR75140.1 hypothetical protein ABH20_01920 [Geobacillus sp. T6]RAN30496.1 hypothetical protein VC88_02430 [Geobacillus sp. A8]